MLDAILQNSAHKNRGLKCAYFLFKVVIIIAGVPFDYVHKNLGGISIIQSSLCQELRNYELDRIVELVAREEVKHNRILKFLS